MKQKKIIVQYCSGKKLELRSDWLLSNGHELAQLIANKLPKVIQGLKKFEDTNKTDTTIKNLRSEILNTILGNIPTLAPMVFRKAFEELSK